jgi:hypothetical protein
MDNLSVVCCVAGIKISGLLNIKKRRLIYIYVVEKLVRLEKLMAH